MTMWYILYWKLNILSYITRTLQDLLYFIVFKETRKYKSLKQYMYALTFLRYFEELPDKIDNCRISVLPSPPPKKKHQSRVFSELNWWLDLSRRLLFKAIYFLELFFNCEKLFWLKFFRNAELLWFMINGHINYNLFFEGYISYNIQKVMKLDCWK